MAKTVWIGLATVEQRGGGGLLGKNAKGGVVNVLALATTASQFEQQVKGAVDELGLTLTELEECESLDDRQAAYTVEEALLEKAREVRETGEVRFGTFHTFKAE